MPPASAGATAAKVLVCVFALFYLLNPPLGGAKKKSAPATPQKRGSKAKEVVFGEVVLMKLNSREVH
jgi:hypothetical protein